MNFVCDSQQMRSRGLWSREARIAEFGVTAEHCGAELLHMAARIAGPAEDADDVVQNALLVALVELSELPAESQMLAWLRDIVRDTALKAKRTRDQSVFESIEALSLHEEQCHLQLVDAGISAERRYEVRELLELVSAILEGMSDARRQVFRMCVLEERRKPQVAAVLNMSPSNVKALMFRTKRALRKEISKISDRRREYAVLHAKPAQSQRGVEGPLGARSRDHNIWSMGFIEHRLARGRGFQVLTLIDQHTRECLALHAGAAWSGEKVAAALDQVMACRGAPKMITVDNGTDLAIKAMDHWSHLNQLHPDFVRPGGPAENGYIESFNRRLRDECLNLEVFFSVVEVRRKLDLWRRKYNLHRPHWALSDRSPAERGRPSCPSDQ